MAPTVPKSAGTSGGSGRSAPEITPSVQGLDPADVNGTIHRYITDQVADEKEREQLLELVEELQGAIRSPA